MAIIDNINKKSTPAEIALALADLAMPKDREVRFVPSTGLSAQREPWAIEVVGNPSTRVINLNEGEARALFAAMKAVFEA